MLLRYTNRQGVSVTLARTCLIIQDHGPELTPDDRQHILEHLRGRELVFGWLRVFAKNLGGLSILILTNYQAPASLFNSNHAPCFPHHLLTKPQPSNHRQIVNLHYELAM